MKLDSPVVILEMYDRLLDISEAAARVDLPEEDIIELINEHKLRGMAYGEKENARLFVLERELLLATISKERYRQKYGLQTVSLREASRRLKVSPSTISRWVQAGFILTAGGPIENAEAKLFLADVLYYEDLFFAAYGENRPRNRLLDKKGNLYAGPRRR